MYYLTACKKALILLQFLVLDSLRLLNIILNECRGFEGKLYEGFETVASGTEISFDSGVMYVSFLLQNSTRV